MRIQIAFYGDDFTGSTDALEVLALHGMAARLFLQPPAPSLVQERYPELEAIGVAGVTRSLRTTELAETLKPAFSAMRQLDPRILHYKICSTFDSSPEVGSIGRAIEIGLEVSAARWCPVIVGAPRLNRWVAFGNLFATFGDQRFRLDRHPVMNRHPVTPMHESDLRMILRSQTDLPIHLVDFLDLERGGLDSGENREGIVAVDTLCDEHLLEIGRWLDHSSRGKTLFSASSSGLEYAWVAHQVAQGKLRSPSKFEPYPTEGPLLIMSGSASEVTAGQIRHWRETGGFEVALDPELLGRDPEAMERAKREIISELRSGRDLLVHSCEGPDDLRLKARPSDGAFLAELQATLLRQVMKVTVPGRLCVAGGDTSGYAMRGLDAESLEFVRPLAPGSPLCRLAAPGMSWNGLTVALKGGQVGRPTFFRDVQRGTTD